MHPRAHISKRTNMCMHGRCTRVVSADEIMAANLKLRIVQISDLAQTADGPPSSYISAKLGRNVESTPVFNDTWEPRYDTEVSFSIPPVREGVIQSVRLSLMKEVPFKTSETLGEADITIPDDNSVYQRWVLMEYKAKKSLRQRREEVFSESTQPSGHRRTGSRAMNQPRRSVFDIDSNLSNSKVLPSGATLVCKVLVVFCRHSLNEAAAPTHTEAILSSPAWVPPSGWGDEHMDVDILTDNMGLTPMRKELLHLREVLLVGATGKDLNSICRRFVQLVDSALQRSGSAENSTVVDEKAMKAYMMMCNDIWRSGLGRAVLLALTRCDPLQDWQTIEYVGYIIEKTTPGIKRAVDLLKRFCVPGMLLGLARFTDRMKTRCVMLDAATAIVNITSPFGGNMVAMDDNLPSIVREAVLTEPVRSVFNMIYCAMIALDNSTARAEIARNSQLVVSFIMHIKEKNSDETIDQILAILKAVCETNSGNIRMLLEYGIEKPLFAVRGKTRNDALGLLNWLRDQQDALEGDAKASLTFYAVSRIQALFRGRRQRHESEVVKKSSIKIQCRIRTFLAKKQVELKRKRQARHEKYRLTQERLKAFEQRNLAELKILETLPAHKVKKFYRDRDEKSASAIQKIWRAKQARKNFREMAKQHIREKGEREDGAARVIQGVFRTRVKGRPPASARGPPGDVQISKERCMDIQRGILANLRSGAMNSSLSMRDLHETAQEKLGERNENLLASIRHRESLTQAKVQTSKAYRIIMSTNKIEDIKPESWPMPHGDRFREAKNRHSTALANATKKDRLHLDDIYDLDWSDTEVA